MEEIKFLNPDKENGWLSNFSPAEVQYNGLTYQTSEHLYQFLKAQYIFDQEKHQVRFQRHVDHSKIRHEIRKAESPKEAKAIFNENYKHEIPLHIRSDIMRKVILEKFHQHKPLRDMLINSSGSIVEVHPKDYTWGCGESGKGLNLMGLLLTELRAILQVQFPPTEKLKRRS